jgi:hypothetical protein
MARRNYYKAWPLEAGIPYQEIVKAQTRMLSIVEDTLKEGIVKVGGVTEFNAFVFERLIPHLERRTKKIQEQCRVLTSLLEEERRGRLPKWYTTALDIHAKAMSILQLLEEEALPALERNEMIYLESIFKCIRAEVKEIKAMLDINPYRPGLEVWEETVEQAVRKLKQ